MVSRVIAKAIAFVRIKIQVKQWQSPPPYASNLSSKSVFLDLVTHPGLKLGLFGLDFRFPLSFDDLLRKRALETTPLLSSSIFEVKRRDWLRLISRLGRLSIQRLCTQKYHMSHAQLVASTTLHRRCNDTTICRQYKPHKGTTATTKKKTNKVGRCAGILGLSLTWQQ